MTYEMGSDYDLESAMYRDAGITIGQVADVLAAVYGDGDGCGYFWVLRLTDGAVGLLAGWHDFTGWDCQGGSKWFPAPDAEAAVALVGTPEVAEFANVADRPVREVLTEQLQGVPPQKSGYQVAFERMGFPKDATEWKDAKEYRYR